MKWKLIWPIALTLLVPLAVSYFVYPNHLPEGFGLFPPQFQQSAPGFSWLYFIFVLAGVVWVGGMLAFPKLYGFKGETPAPAAATKSLPWWFWAGALVTGFFWYLMWSHSTAFGELVYWSFTPMWWGFIFVLDGLVYRRNDGKSLFSTRPVVLLISGLVSIGGWAYFEFYDYFVFENWYYPYADKAPWSSQILSIEFLLTYSTVTPVIFEWFCLLNTFPKLVARYANGPKLPLKGNTLILIGLVMLAAMVVLPYPLFWAVWIGPMVVVTGVLMKLNIWNPVKDLADGDWRAMNIIGLASLCNGLFWEFWNHGSMAFVSTTTNPNYWIYDIPYVNVIHLFSEMPLLGYFGYVPFGVLVWQVYIWSGALVGFNSDIRPGKSTSE